MRRWLLVTFVLLPVVEAQDGGGRAAALAQARRDLQAQLEVADMLLDRGDVEAAELAYRKAMERFAAALGGAAEAEKPKPVPKLEPEDPALRADEAKRVRPVWGGRRPLVKKGADLCVYLPPKWNPDDGSIDMYYWYWGTLAMFQVGGTHWRKWNEAIVEAVVKHQHRAGSGSRTGSWDPLDPWGPDGGRVYSTAMLTMCMEVYYRYHRVFGGK
jgi:hypothetical protein